MLQELDAAEPAEGPAMADLLRLRVRALMALGRLEEAVPALRAAVEAAPSDPQPRIALANLLRLLGRAGEGAAVLDAMADRPEVRRARIQLLLVAQRAPEARALFPEVAADAATPEDVAWLIRLAARLHGAGTGYEAACRLLRDRLEAIGAETPAARLAAARLHFALGQLPAFRAAAAASLAAGVDEESARVLEALLRATATPSAPQGRRRVFVVGLSKTGTTSVATALGRLGWLAQHWVHPLTGNLLTAEDAVTFDAMADTPVADAAEELAASWPDALFILTRRPVASWVRSWEGHFRRANAVDGLEGMRALVARPELCEHGPRFAALFQRLYTRHPDLPTAFAAHDARIRALFADQPNRLLEFDLVSGDSWEKLCGFLGVPVPAGPFPRENARPDAAR